MSLSFSPFWRNFALVTTLAVTAIIPVACGSSSDDEATGGKPSGTGTAVGGEGGCAFCNGTGGNAGALVITPPNATITVADGVSAPVDFNASFNGQDVQPSWIVDLSAVANVDTAGLVGATGSLGGLVRLRASYQGNTADATIEVKLKKTINPNNFPQSDIDLLRNASTPDASLAWAYPYDKTVWPKGINSPELMWNGTGAGDKYLVHLVGPFVDFEIFTLADPPSRHALDPITWTELTESGSGDVDVDVARLPNGAASANKAIDHTWKIANGSLRGTVYYWSNNLGRVLRIKPGDTAPEDFLAANGFSSNCSTCHAVSANGSTLILGGDIDVSNYDLLTNTSTFITTSVGKPIRNWAMPAINPDGTYLIENNAPLPGPPGGSDGMWNAKTGAKLTGTGLEGVLLDMPAFSPDGKLIAFVDHTSGALATYAFDVAIPSVSARNELVPAGAGAEIAFPSISPDSKQIVYHRGPLDTRAGVADLYMGLPDQPGQEIALDNLNGETYPFAAGERDRHWNYEPTYAPLPAGGYNWVVFTARRTYGNRLTGGKDSVKQLWVAAVDINAQPGVDPSHPAFRVPGQDDNLNMRGYWALEPCKMVGATCGTGSECCNGNCDFGVCTEPEGCSETGNACMVAADCCETGSECINGFCSDPPPQ